MKRLTIVGALVVFALSECAIASPALPVTTVTIDTCGGQRAFKAELASDPQSQQQGLMYRQQMSPNAGMLFDFHTSTMLSFWMKNTILPLDMLFIRDDGTISTIAANAVPLSTARIDSAEPVRAVLEINGGRAKELGIRAGDRVHSVIFHNVR